MFQYQIGVSNDGTTFQTVVGPTNATTPSETTNDVATRGRYVRVTVTAAGNDIQVQALNVYGVLALPPDQNRVPTDCACAGAQPVRGQSFNTRTGNLWAEAADLRLAGAEPALVWTRRYASQATGEGGPLGYGWQHSFATRLITPGMPSGEAGW
jgi:hypothetical protein